MISVSDIHFIVLVHGNHGHSNDFLPLAHYIESIFEGGVHILRAKANQTNTEIGIRQGGKALAGEISDELKNLRKTYPSHSHRIKVTLCGHSLGGLFLRASLQHLFGETELNENIEWINFVTLNTPHLGVRKPGGNFFKHCHKLIVHVACTLGNGISGDDLILDTDVIHELCQENFLENFKFVTLVSLAHNDLLVPYPTSSVRAFNPYPVDTFFAPLSLVGSQGFSDERYHKLSFRNVSLGSNETKPETDNVVGNNTMTVDNYVHSELKTESLQSFASKKINWRRLDLNVGQFFAPIAHDFTIHKYKYPYKGDKEGSEQWIAFLSNIFHLDHHLT